MDTQPKRLNRSGQAGMTLLEVLIAAAILSVGLMAWTVLQTQNIEGRSRSGSLTKAVEVGQSFMDRMSARAQRWSGSDPTVNGTDSVTMQSETFTVSWAANNQGNLVPAGLSAWLVNATVQWDHYGQHSIDFQRIVVGR
jgi:type IV pilus modification protein PilV